MKNNKLFLLFISFCLLPLAGCFNPPMPKPDSPVNWDTSQDYLRTGEKVLNFFNLNDTHGAVNYSSDSSEPGIAKLSTYLLNEKNKDNDGFILTSSGDMWQGSADSNITKGGLIIDWMNYLQFDAMAIGNHEFDWTIDTINSNQKAMNFPLLACNIIDKNSNKPVDWVKPFTTITKKGVHIGIIGAIGEGQTSDIMADNVRGLKFANPTNYVINYSNYLRENGADIILYLVHSSTQYIDSSLANYVDLIFGAHNHMNENVLIGNKVPAIEASCNGKYVGQISLRYSFSNKNVTIDKKYYNKVSLSINDDPNTLKLWDKYRDLIDSTINKVCARTTKSIQRNNVPYVYNKYAYEYFVNYSGEDFNTSSYNIYAVETNNARAAIYSKNGVITYGDVYKSLPFDNCLCLCKVKGKNIKNDMCSYSSSHWYLPGSTSENSINQVISGLKDNVDYYILTIDYIAVSEYYTSWMNIVHTFYNEDALPRNIVSNRLQEYVNSL